MTEPGQQLARAGTMLDLRRYDEAVTLLGSLVAADPGNSRAWALLARAQLGAGRAGEAALAANQAVMLAPSDDWPHRLASIAQLRLGNKAEALRAAQEACRLAPHEWRSHLSLAQAALATKVHRNLAGIAEPAAATARMLAPSEPDVHFVSGQISLARGDRRAAQAHQQRALAIDPAHGPALNELGRISLQRRGYARAARHFLQAVRTAPGTSVYSSNIEVAVRQAVAVVIYLASALSFLLILVTLNVRLSRPVTLAAAAGVVLVIAGLGALQFWRMPRELRPLFRRRHVVRALSVCYGASLLAITLVAVTPARVLPGVAGLVYLLLLGARFAAIGFLRGKRGQPRT